MLCFVSERVIGNEQRPHAWCRYLFQHGYNISLVEVVDKIASPLVKNSYVEWTYKKLDEFPTPADYALALTTCISRCP